MNWPDVVAAATAQDPADLPASDIRILDATIEVLGSCGEQRLTIDMVADRAHMSRMTVFRRFGSKQNLIDTAYRREISKALRDITEYAENTDTPQRRAVAIAIRMIDNASRIPPCSGSFDPNRTKLSGCGATRSRPGKSSDGHIYPHNFRINT
ncbi:Putative TetR-family transcriptional regulator [Mycobacteroides abscessus]|nr:Putative TetR-family transcriptional regulator [Mycobacteroides abscessus]